MFELNRRYFVQMPMGQISDSGMLDIVKFMIAQRMDSPQWATLNPKPLRIDLPLLPDDWQWVWVITGKAEYVGTFPKRVSKYLYKQGYKCPPEFLQTLGTLAKMHSGDSVSYTFEIVDRIDWNSGDFGDSGSCYWGSHVPAKGMVEDNGYAIRFFDSFGAGLGRAWIALYEADLHIFFNGYGFDNGPLTIARVFAFNFGLSYKRIALENNGTSNGMLYINGGYGYAVGTTQRLATLTPVDLEWESPCEDTCTDCGDCLNEDEVYIGADDAMYCRNCFYDHFDTCEHCGQACYQDGITYIAHAEIYVCEHCLDRRYGFCDECEEWYLADQITHHEATDRYYCESCYPADPAPESE